ncbi:universal stress protein [Janibacter sp. RAF20_2_2]|uniref:universal stress protein n=1 Tax=unclassified Janibacter TaxID=2649294 RepID=UPI003F908738
MSEAPRPYTVVVGVSTTSGSPAALRWAAAQVALNEGRLVAVRAWKMTATAGSTSGVIAASTPRERDVVGTLERSLAADVAAVLGPDHGAELRLVRGGHRRVLLEAAEGADLLVIDAPRRLAGEPMFAQRLLERATCPVVAMPPSISEQPLGMVERAGRAIGRAAVRSAGTAGRPGYRPPAPPRH